MIHAPVSSEDLAQVQAADAGVDSLAFDAATERLRDAHLYNGQVEARGLFAGFLALTGIVAAGITAWALAETLRLDLVAGWFGLVVVANAFAYHRAMTAASWSGGRNVRLGRRWVIVVEAAALAAFWAVIPAYAFANQPPAAQVVIGGAMATMIVAAVALAAIPAAATAWIATFTAAFAAAYYLGGGVLDTRIALTFVLTAGVAAFGVARLSRWIFGHLEATARTRTQWESVRLLLNEYEHRGVGWLWQVDAENRVAYISTRMTALLGRSTSQLIGHSLPASLGGSSALGRTLLARQPFSNLEMELATRHGTRWISLSGDPIIDMAGQFQGFRGVGQDVTEVRKNQERLTEIANKDALTGLPNRGRVRRLLGEALSAANASGAPCAILFLDLDGFKPVNDTFGHPKGDAVLKTVATRLKQEVGTAGLVGRMGGDEFAIVMKNAPNRRMVAALAARLIETIAEPYHVEKAELRIGVSIGCAFGPLDGQSVDDLILKADLALYQAKANGRGTCCFFDPDMQSEAEDRIRLERDLKAGIGLNQFRLLYQPLINATDQSLVGFEALIRWHHPTRGIVPPTQFIPIAEESGLIMELGDWVVDEACRALARWPEPVTVAINISAKQLVFPALPNTIHEILGRHRLAANRLELEVTESIFLGDSKGALDVLKRLRALGVGIALDDFGTGYSSLGYLNKAVFHKLKIDGSFVRESATDRESVAIIQAIVQLAKSFRMTVTAEGVETADDFTRMRELGCQQIQGYLFGRPMTFEKASELVAGLRQQRRMRA